jgi:hypothetical protein
VDLLIADRDNNRVLIVSPAKRILWRAGGLPGPDDAFFTPGGRSIITNEEFNDTLAEVSLRTRRVIWPYGSRRRSRRQPRLPEHAGRRLPAEDRRLGRPPQRGRASSGYPSKPDGLDVMPRGTKLTHARRGS